MKDKPSCSNLAPPPPRARVNALKFLIFIVVALGLLGAAPALAQDIENPLIDLQLAEAGPDCLWVSWIASTDPSATVSLTVFRGSLNTEEQATITTANDGFHMITGLSAADTTYLVYVSIGGGEDTVISYSTTAAGSPPCGYVPPKKDKSEPEPTPMPTPRPAVNSCPNLPHDIVIIGFASYHSQCRAVDAGGVGRADLVQRGIIAAVDIWYHVPGTGIGVCFRNSGAAVVFLDAAYSPRQLSTLNHLTLPNGMTCAVIRSPGTVVLLAS